MSHLTWLGVPGDEHAWTTLGFTVDDGTVQIGHVSCSFTAEPAWGFDVTYADVAVLGVPTEIRFAAAPTVHANGVTTVDHIVYTVPDLDDAIEHLNKVLGEGPRRRFHPRGSNGPEMAFYRVGEAFIEVVATGKEPALIGLALSAPDLNATVAAIRAAGGPIGDPKPAVQGGRIASIWNGHLNWGLAIMEPPAE